MGDTVADHIIALVLDALASTECNDAKSTVEKRFIAKGSDTMDVMHDPELADWVCRAQI
jgi:hypothetical protein